MTTRENQLLTHSMQDVLNLFRLPRHVGQTLINTPSPEDAAAHVMHWATVRNPGDQLKELLKGAGIDTADLQDWARSEWDKARQPAKPRRAAATSTRVEQGRYLTEDEEKLLRQRCRERADADRVNGRSQGIRAQAVVELALYTGARVCELQRLTVGAVDLGRTSQKTIKVATAKQRSKDAARVLPLTDALADYLRGWIEWKKQAGEPVGPDAPLVASKQDAALTIRGWQDAWESACIRAGLVHSNGKSRFSIHDARHTVGMKLWRRKKDLLVVQRWLGHTTPTVTAKFYATATLDDLRAAAED